MDVTFALMLKDGTRLRSAGPIAAEKAPTKTQGGTPLSVAASILDNPRILGRANPMGVPAWLFVDEHDCHIMVVDSQSDAFAVFALDNLDVEAFPVVPAVGGVEPAEEPADDPTANENRDYEAEGRYELTEEEARLADKPPVEETPTEKPEVERDLTASLAQESESDAQKQEEDREEAAGESDAPKGDAGTDGDTPSD